jgi:hypothetical protein
MLFPYTVKAGDNLTALARRFGLPSWKAIYNDPANKDFRAQRPDPNLIQPGDLVMIPGAGPPPPSAGAAPAAPSPGGATVSVVPFRETAPLLIATQPHDPTKGDLRSVRATSIAHLPRTTQVKIVAARLVKTEDLELQMTAELGVGGGMIGLGMAGTFFANPSPLAVVDHPVGSPLSKEVQASPEFARAHAAVQRAISAAVAKGDAAGSIDYQDLAAPKKKVPPPSLGFGGFHRLHVLIGSFQGVNVFLNSFTADPARRTYSASLTYEFFDHFGVDDTDTIWDGHGHGSPGQVALWVLQRERHPGHMPYITRVIIEQPIADERY